MPTSCEKVKFALVDAIETKCLEGISEEAFVQKISGKRTPITTLRQAADTTVFVFPFLHGVSSSRAREVSGRAVQIRS